MSDFILSAATIWLQIFNEIKTIKKKSFRSSQIIVKMSSEVENSFFFLLIHSLSCNFVVHLKEIKETREMISVKQRLIVIRLSYFFWTWTSEVKERGSEVGRQKKNWYKKKSFKKIRSRMKDKIRSENKTNRIQV
jgi:hypothetical protein